jgi:hypothetical protein
VTMKRWTRNCRRPVSCKSSELTTKCARGTTDRRGH